MAAGTWQVYDQTEYKIGLKQINLSSDTLKCALYTAASNASDLTLNPCTLASLTNQVATAFGYSVGGFTLTGVTWTNAAGVETLDSNNASWTAVGGAITAKYAVIYDSTTNDLIAVCDLNVGDGTGLSATDGNPFTVQMSASGIFALRRAV